MRLRRKKALPLGAQIALQAAEDSRMQANEDLRYQQEALREANEVADKIRRHNIANHFDDFLLRILSKG